MVITVLFLVLSTLTISQPASSTQLFPKVIPPSVSDVVPPKVSGAVPSKIPDVPSPKVPDILHPKLPDVVPTKLPNVIPTKVPDVLHPKLPYVVPTKLPNVIPTKVPEIIPSELPDGIADLIDIAFEFQERDLTKEPTDIEIYRSIVSSLRHLKRQVPIFREACYDLLGCFSSNETFAHLLGILPASPLSIDLEFNLFTQKNPDTPVVLKHNSANNSFDSYDPLYPTVFITHGFGSSSQVDWVQQIKNNYLQTGPMNVITVDWNKGAPLPNYLQATANTQIVGRMIAVMCVDLIKQGADPAEIHLIGHSLGAHTSGFAGQYIQTMNYTLGRITGLDPAGPLFCYDVADRHDERLSKEDAMFVDIIHSNGGIIFLCDLGCYDPLGHVDFYPNGGRHQRGCASIIVDTLGKVLFQKDDADTCSSNHGRACNLFAESIIARAEHPECKFTGFPCSSFDDFLQGTCFPCNDSAGSRHCGYMGDPADEIEGRGRLYLMTMEKSFLCGNHYRVSATWSGDSAVLPGQLKLRLKKGDNLTDVTSFSTGSNVLSSSSSERSMSSVLIDRSLLLHDKERSKPIEAYVWHSNSILKGIVPKKDNTLHITSVNVTDENGNTICFNGSEAVPDSEGQLTIELSPAACVKT